MDSDLSRFKVKQPCRNCPFRNDETRIRFRGRERAEEIEEHTYRRGSPCHETAETHEDPLTGDESFWFGEHSSHCAGYIVIRLKSNGGGGAPWPAIDNDDELSEALSEHLGPWLDMPVFENEEEFFRANETDDDRRTREAREAAEAEAQRTRNDR